MIKRKAEVAKATEMQNANAYTSRSAFRLSLTRLTLFVNAFMFFTCKVLLSVDFLIEPCYIFLEGFFGYIPDQLEVGLT